MANKIIIIIIIIIIITNCRLIYILYSVVKKFGLVNEYHVVRAGYQLIAIYTTLVMLSQRDRHSTVCELDAG